jgi:hypothetical protein
LAGTFTVLSEVSLGFSQSLQADAVVASFQTPACSLFVDYPTLALVQSELLTSVNKPYIYK